MATDGRFWTARRAGSALIAAVVSSGLAGTAAAQSERAVPPGAYVAAVAGETALVRSGASEHYYPFGKLRTGSLVLVVGRKEDWGRISAVGPAFAALDGYLIVPRSRAERIEMQDEKLARVTDHMDVVAPNLNSDGSPGDSWKALAKLEPGATVSVRERFESGPDLVLRIALPASAIGWINLGELRAATVAETRRWESVMTDRDAAVAQAAPKVEPAPKTEIARAPEAAPDRAPAEAAAEKTTIDVTAPGTPAEPPVLGRKESPAPTVTRPGDPAASTSLAPSEPPAVTARRAAQPAARPADAEAQLEQLEVAYERLRREDIRTAEVAPLRSLYLALASDSPGKKAVSRYAKTRAEQLEVWEEVQQRRRELDRMRTRVDEAGAEVRAARRALEQSARYDVVGRLRPSSIYDGHRLPRLLRVLDPGSGRTVAYVEPGEGDEVLGHMGQLVGIVGTKEYDGSLRVHLVRPEQIEVLTSDGDARPSSRITTSPSVTPLQP